MIRAVLDANVLGPGLTLDHGLLVTILRLWQADRFELVVSDHLIAEIQITLAKPYWEARIPEERVKRALVSLRRTGIRVVPDPDIANVATHWHDDIVIATAVSGNAEYLVTGDKELLRIRRFRDVVFVSPSEFLTVLQSGEESS